MTERMETEERDERREHRLKNPFLIKLDAPTQPAVVIRCLPRESFASDAEFHEYGRNFCIRLVSSWLAPQLSRCLFDLFRTEVSSVRGKGLVKVEKNSRAVAAETLLYVLGELLIFTDQMLGIFFTRDYLASPTGESMLAELRHHLAPGHHLGAIQRPLIMALQFSHVLFCHLTDVDMMAMLRWKTPKEQMQPADEPRRAEIRQLYEKFRRVFGKEGVESPTSLLRGSIRRPLLIIAHKFVRRIVDASCEDICSNYVYHEIQHRLMGLERWVEEILGQKEALDEELEEKLDKEIIKALTLKIFELTISEFPRSDSTVEVLRYCLGRQNHHGRELLVDTLIREVKRRLLHVGVSTAAILQAYASAVESLRLLDSSCVIMHRVCRVIKEYIKKRPDTVRQIITYITTEKRDELGEQLVCEIKKRGTIVDEEDVAGVNDEFLPGPEEDSAAPNWFQWTPDPPDAQPGESGRFRQSADVFNMLVSVYGSKEMFVKEYRQLLAERLSATATKDPLFERRYLELLKLRFSEGELQQCEVMLKDVTESDRIENDAKTRASLISGRIISSHFWPPIEKEKGVEQFPDPIENAMAEYGRVYQDDSKQHRRLEWIRSAGCMEMTLTVDGVSVEKIVPNSLAPIIFLFNQKDEWELSELCSVLDIPRPLAKRRLDWWQTQGVIVQFVPSGATSEFYRLTKQPGNMQKCKGTMETEEEEEDVAEAEDPQDAVDSLEQYWKYTKTYIANQENSEIRPERLLQIYRMFASPSSHALSLDTVIAFLQRKVKLNLLTLHNGMYRVVKEPPAAESKV